MPEPIEVRKVPLHSVSDASELTKLIDDGVHRRRPGHRRHRQDRGQRRRQRLHPHHRRPGVPRGARREGHAQRRRGQAGADRVVRRHGRRDQPARDDLRDAAARTRRVQTDEPRLSVGLRDERGAAARGHRSHRDDHQGRRRGEGGDGARRHHRPGRRALRPDQDAAADDRHDPRRQEPRARRVHRGHADVDGRLQRRHGARRRRRARRDRHAARRGRAARPLAVLVGRLLLVRRRARPRAGGRGRQRARRRRALPDRARRHDGRARPGRHLGRDPLGRPRAARASAHRPIWTAGWSTCSSSARPARTVRCAGGATPCSTTRTCTGTARSRPASAASPPPSPATRPCSSACRAAHQGPDGGGPVAAIVDLG